jgi:hypothetical protein
MTKRVLISIDLTFILRTGETKERKAKYIYILDKEVTTTMKEG